MCPSRENLPQDVRNELVSRLDYLRIGCVQVLASLCTQINRASFCANYYYQPSDLYFCDSAYQQSSSIRRSGVVQCFFCTSDSFSPRLICACIWPGMSLAIILHVSR